MTDDWDFYAVRVDDKPGSIYVDLGAERIAPDADLRHMAYIRLFMRQPRPDGLSSQEEYETLIAIEDALTAGLCGPSAAYVGRCTSDGCRDFYFYISVPGSWSRRVDDELSDFDGYEFETGVLEDPDWSTYFRFLLPSETDRHRIQKRRACEALEHRGDKLINAREIDHWCYFPDDPSLRAFVAEALETGFAVRKISVGNSGQLRHCAQVWRSDVPAYDQINDVTLPLFESARKHGGEYDGWECRVDA
jgi:hypothetical protein